MRKPSRGQVWRANLSPTKGHETHGTRPCLIITVDRFNHGPADLVVVLPITTREKGIPFHVSVNPPEGGLSERSFIKSEEIHDAFGKAKAAGKTTYFGISSHENTEGCLMAAAETGRLFATLQSSQPELITSAISSVASQ